MDIELAQALEENAKLKKENELLHKMNKLRIDYYNLLKEEAEKYRKKVANYQIPYTFRNLEKEVKTAYEVAFIQGYNRGRAEEMSKEDYE